jgi:very-short-patch-repair endonuclease
MRTPSAKVRVARLAAKQSGRVSRAQLTHLGVADATVNRWLRQGYLHRLLPRVYAVGHPGRSTEGDLFAAVLYAGPDAMLSHATAAWWMGLVDRRPSEIHVSTPRRCRSLPGICIHRRRSAERVWHDDLPVTTVARTLLDYVATAPWPRLRRALANADYRRMLDLGALDAELRPGRQGAARLRAALEQHRPELARARSDLEVACFELWERARLPLPKLNARLHGWTVDFYWPERRLVVEVDGVGNHRSPAQIRRDRRMDQQLRAHGLTVLRYSDEQVTDQGPALAGEIQAIPPVPSDGPGSR